MPQAAASTPEDKEVPRRKSKAEVKARERERIERELRQMRDSGGQVGRAGGAYLEGAVGGLLWYGCEGVGACAGGGMWAGKGRCA